MPQTLERLDPSRTASVLALAARTFLPRPTDDQATNQTDQAAAADLIKELSTRAVSGRPGATSQIDTVAVQEALSRQISSYLLSGVDSASVRARVGDKGALSPSLYRVSFTPKFQHHIAMWGLSKNHILNAIAKCDQFQHFVSKIEALNAPAHTSLFVQIPPVKRDIYTILVKCQRAGDNLMVDEAYRIYHDEIDLSGTIYPLDILARFVDKFGEEVELIILNADETTAKPSQKGRLIHDVVVHDLPQDGFIINKYSNGEIVRVGPITSDAASIDLCYEVNYVKYVSQLLRHGIKAEVPKGRMTAFTVRNVPPP